MHFTKTFFVISALTLILANGGTASKIGKYSLLQLIPMVWYCFNVHISSHFSFKFQLVPELGIRCGDLQARRSCKSTKNYINVYSPSLQNCLKACTEESKGTPGCCEYQVDWKKCVFVPGDIGIRTASTGGAVNRYATQCSYQGL